MPSHRIGTATNLFGSYILNKIYELELAEGNIIIVQGGGQELAGGITLCRVGAWS